MAIKHEEGAVTQRAVPGPALYFVSALPEGKKKAIVGILHGYADYGARYAHVMDAWAAKGIGAVAIDMRGHGRASGRRGYCARFDEFLDDAAELSRLVSDRANGAPTFLFGHSFGALVATHSVLESPRSWKGLMLASPYFDLAMKVPPAKLLAGRVASRIMPKLALPTGLTGAQVTHDAVRALAYDNDPLVFKNATARWFTETGEAQKRALARAGSLKLPLHMVFGADDPIARPEAGKVFFDAAGSEDKTWDLRKGLLHETWNEPEWPEIAGSLADFVLRHSGN